VRIPDTHSSESGLTIVEIVVASAILLVLALTMSTMLFNSQKQMTKIQDRAERADFIQGAALDLRLRPVPTP